jgi:plasmid stability protein
MGQVLIRKLGDQTLEAYRATARAKGRSLEAELREVIEMHRPLPQKGSEELLRLSARLRAMASPENPKSDSTLLIRWDRDTDGGRRLNDG